MTALGWLRSIPITLRAPLVTAVLMIALGLVASRGVLSALTQVQDARLSETARLHVEGLSVALGPAVLRQDVWEVYDILDRARLAYDGQRLLLTVVADERDRVLAATDPRRLPVGADMSGFAADAVPPQEVRMTGDPVLRISAPIGFQGREVGAIVTEIDVTDLLQERRRAIRWLLLGNALATLVLTFSGWLAVARILRPVGTLVGAMDDSGGAPKPVAASAAPRGDPGLARLFATYNRMAAAVEERAEAERRLAERERFVSLGRLASSLAHEINNPLGGLLTAADTIRTYADRPAVVRQSAELMERGLQHLRDVTRATLDQYRLDRTGQPLRMEDLDDTRTLFESQTHSRVQTLDWTVDAAPGTLAALPAAPVRQVALNLLLNASAAATLGGRIGFSVVNGGDRLCITVRDTGPGLGADDLGRLMGSGPLPPGGGVGLRLVRDIVTGLHGTIDYRRTDNESEIRVTLPAVSREPGSSDHA